MKKILITIIVVLLASCEQPINSKKDYPIYFDVLGYSDYYNGNCIALKMDIYNNTNYTVKHIRPQIKLVYTDYSSQVFYPDIYISLEPGQVEYSLWVEIACGMVFYKRHYFGEIKYWDSEGNMYAFDYGEILY